DLMAEYWNPNCAPAWDYADLAVKVDNAYCYAQEEVGSGVAMRADFTPVAANDPGPEDVTTLAHALRANSGLLDDPETQKRLARLHRDTPMIFTTLREQAGGNERGGKQRFTAVVKAGAALLARERKALAPESAGGRVVRYSPDKLIPAVDTVERLLIDDQREPRVLSYGSTFAIVKIAKSAAGCTRRCRSCSLWTTLPPSGNKLCSGCRLKFFLPVPESGTAPLARRSSFRPFLRDAAGRHRL
ncbi:MAG: hypothetical protein FD153_621, partial [Rhodospirillaceae bacterium]